MAKKKIRLNFFYTDNAVWEKAITKKRQDEMVKWSNDFFGKYDFELDIYPFPYDSKMYQQSFLFQTSIEPDISMDLLAQKMRRISADKKKLEEKLDEPNLSATDIADIKEKLKKLNKEDDDLLWDGFNKDSEYEFRISLGKKFFYDKKLLSLEKDFKKNPRLDIVFCKFVNLTQKSTVHGDADTIGLQNDRLNSAMISDYKKFNKPIPLYRAPFIAIDLFNANDDTIAHEVVHSAGHKHPDKGGEYDGPYTSVMNYYSSGLYTVADITLEPEDQKRMEVAFFVK